MLRARGELLPLNDPTVFVTLTSAQERTVVACNPKAIFQRRLISPLPLGLPPGEKAPLLPEADMSFIIASAAENAENTPLFTHAQIERENIFQEDEYGLGEETQATAVDERGEVISYKPKKLDREERLAVKGVYLPIKPPTDAILVEALVQSGYEQSAQNVPTSSSMVGYIPHFSDQVRLPDGFVFNLPSAPGQSMSSAPSIDAVVAPSLGSFDTSASEKKKKLLKTMEANQITLERVRTSNQRSKTSYTVDQLMEVATLLEMGPMKGNKQALISGILAHLNKFGIN